MRILSLVLLSALASHAAEAATPSPERVARQLDRLIAAEAHAEASADEIAPRCDDQTFVRRVWLDIVGDIPTPEEVTAFVLDPRPNKRKRLVARLLASPQYGQNWARYWRDVILTRRIEQRAVLVSNPMVVKLTEQLNQDTGWDQIAAEFITATGDVRENGSAAIIMAQEGRTEETAAEVSRVFLGIQIQCAQCHDHPWDRWQREQFHELAAFFPRTGLQQVRTPTRRSYAVVVNDRPQRRAPRNAEAAARRGVPEHYMPDLNNPDKPGQRTQPRFFLTNAELPFGTRDADRRGQLAQWLTDSPWFATALANRMWAELVGEGFYPLVDDLGPDREAIAPSAIGHLSEHFAASGYDVKWLFRTICATQAYQRQARPRRGAGGVPMAANVPQRLRGDQLYSALLTALGVDESSTRSFTPSMGAVYGTRITGRMAFTQAFGYDPSIDRESVAASIPQALAMMNTPQLNAAVRAGRRTTLGRLASKIDRDDRLVDELYLRCLSREPTGKERENALAYVADVGRRTEAFEDLFWALLNSAEFSHRR